MAHAYHAQTGTCQRDAFLLLQQQQDSVYILLHGPGIATGTVAPCNAGLRTIGRIDMIIPYGGGTDKPDTAAFKQPTVTTGAGTHQQRIGILYHRRRELPARQEDRFYPDRLKHPFQIGNLIVYNYFHAPNKGFLPQKYTRNTEYGERYGCFFQERSLDK